MLASISGFVVVTLSITYLLPINSAAVQKRAVTLHIAELGRTPEALVQVGWDGESFAGLEPHFTDLLQTISRQRWSFSRHTRYDEPRSHEPKRLNAIDAALPESLGTSLAYLLAFANYRCFPQTGQIPAGAVPAGRSVSIHGMRMAG